MIKIILDDAAKFTAVAFRVARHRTAFVLISIIVNPGAAVMFRQGGSNSGTIPVFILKLLVLYHMPFALKSEGLYR